MHFLFLLIVAPFLISINAHEEEVFVPVKRDKNTKLVFVGTRHGNRNPGQYLKGISGWGQEGENELTKFGKRQAFALGKSVREFIGDLVEVEYLPKETKAYSSSANRCQMTLQSALAGIFPPKGFAEWGKIPWTPVPYTIDDPMLRMYAVSPCPKSDKVWQPISEDTLPDLTKLTKEKKELLDYIAKNTGWNASISNAADVADNLIEIKLYKGKNPDWIAKPTLKGYDGAKMEKAIMEFAENHQIACADYEPCRNMMGGVWLKNILDAIQKRLDGKANDLNLVVYAAHTEITLSIMKQMGIDKKEVTTSAGFVLEFRDKPEPSVRLLNHDPHENPDEHTIYQAHYQPQLKAICKDNWCPFDAFKKLVGPTTISDWKAECGLPKCA